jgi:hypothetical protein
MLLFLTTTMKIKHLIEQFQFKFSSKELSLAIVIVHRMTILSYIEALVLILRNNGKKRGGCQKLRTIDKLSLTILLQAKRIKYKRIIDKFKSFYDS